MASTAKQPWTSTTSSRTPGQTGRRSPPTKRDAPSASKFNVPNGSDIFTCGMAEDTMGGCETFECRRCGLSLPIYEKNDDCDKTQKDICEKCHSNYKALTRRWKKNKALKKWFADKTDCEKKEWYATRRQSGVPDPWDKQTCASIGVGNY